MTSSSSSPSSSKASAQASAKPSSEKQSAKKRSAKKTTTSKTAQAPAEVVTPKRPCRVTVSAPGWHGARTAAIAAGCSSVSDMIEKLGSGELSIIASDAMFPEALPQTTSQQMAAPGQPQHIHIHTTPSAPVASNALASDEDDLIAAPTSLPRLITTGICAAVIVGSLLYIADRIITITSNVITGQTEEIADIITPLTGEIVAGYRVSDEYGIRPFHPVTGAPNVPHNGVDLAMDIGTPIHAVGKVGDRVTVKCWWDIDGGGWVVNQTAESYPGYIFQSLHMSENGCREGKATAGDAIAYSGNSGLGTGAHYDFRVKIDGQYVPPATKYLESAVTGEPPKE